MTLGMVIAIVIGAVFVLCMLIVSVETFAEYVYDRNHPDLKPDQSKQLANYVPKDKYDQLLYRMKQLTKRLNERSTESEGTRILIDAYKNVCKDYSIEIDKLREKVYNLFKLLDDIDTTGDMYKGNINARLQRVDGIADERHKILSECEIDSLYHKFYKEEEDILTPVFKEVTNNGKKI
jgi:uncharacterized coiled-coil DUF342 family protein